MIDVDPAKLGVGNPSPPASLPSALVYPAERGGCLDLHNFRIREWKPAQDAAESSHRAGSTMAASRRNRQQKQPLSRR